MPTEPARSRTAVTNATISLGRELRALDHHRADSRGEASVNERIVRDVVELNAHRDAGLLGDCKQGGEEQAAGGRAKRGLGDQQDRRHAPSSSARTTPRCRSQERCSIRSSLEAGGVEATSTKEESG